MKVSRLQNFIKEKIGSVQSTEKATVSTKENIDAGKATQTGTTQRRKKKIFLDFTNTPITCIWCTARGKKCINGKCVDAEK